MATHRRSSPKKLAPSLVLLFSIFSVTSPLVLLFTSEEEPTQEDPPLVFIPPINQANAATAAVLAKAKRVAPSYTAIRESTSHTAKPSAVQTVEKDADPPPATSSRQRTSQRSTSSTLTTSRPSTRTAPTSKPQIVRQTTTPKPPPTPAPIPKTTTKQPITTKTTSSSIPKTTTASTIPKETTDPPKAPSPQPVRSPQPTHQLLAQIAQKYVGRGIPYQMGGNILSGGMDCSHFVWMVLKEAGYNVPYRSSGALASWTSSTRTNSPQPGDLVLFKGHVGIFVSPGMMIDQGRSGGAHLSTIKYYDNFIGYGRLPI